MSGEPPPGPPPSRIPSGPRIPTGPRAQAGSRWQERPRHERPTRRSTQWGGPRQGPSRRQANPRRRQHEDPSRWRPDSRWREESPWREASRRREESSRWREYSPRRRDYSPRRRERSPPRWRELSPRWREDEAEAETKGYARWQEGQRSQAVSPWKGDRRMAEGEPFPPPFKLAKRQPAKPSKNRGNKIPGARRDRTRMIRFLDQQKGMRRTRKIEKILEAAQDPMEREKIQQAFHTSQVDVAYAEYFPAQEPYVQLWPRKQDADVGKEEKEKSAADDHDHGQDDERPIQDVVLEEVQNRPVLWFAIKEAMAEGQEALEQIRDRRNVAEFHSKPMMVQESRGSGPSADDNPEDVFEDYDDMDAEY